MQSRLTKQISGSNAGEFSKIPQQLKDAKSTLANIQTLKYPFKYATQIQDASGILNKFVSEKLDASKKSAACAGTIPAMGKPKFKVSSSPINAAITTFFWSYEKHPNFNLGNNSI